MTYNVFIAFTKAQLIHIKNVIRTEQLSNNIIISRYKIDTELRNFSIEVYEIMGSFFQVRKQWIIVNKKLASLSKVELYIAHSFNIFTQGIQHTLIENNKLNSINVFPDGNLLFNNFSITVFNRLHLYKKLISIIFSTKYIIFKGEIISPFLPIDKVYSYLPEVTCSHNQLNLIDMPKGISNKSSENRSLLILGHRNQKVISSSTLLEVLNNNNKISHIYYKPHPRLPLDNDSFYKALQLQYGNNIELINDDSPIESLIELFPISHLFAVASSSLITLKILMPQIEVSYFGLEEYLGAHFDPLIKKQFNKLGLIEWYK